MHENPRALWLFDVYLLCCSLLHGVENPLTAPDSDEIRCASLFIIKGEICSIALYSVGYVRFDCVSCFIEVLDGGVKEFVAVVVFDAYGPVAFGAVVSSCLLHHAPLFFFDLIRCYGWMFRVSTYGGRTMGCRCESVFKNDTRCSTRW